MFESFLPGSDYHVFHVQHFRPQQRVLLNILSISHKLFELKVCIAKPEATATMAPLVPRRLPHFPPSHLLWMVVLLFPLDGAVFSSYFWVVLWSGVMRVAQVDEIIE